MADWEIQGQEFINCSCKDACPCQFAGLPTEGGCEAVGAMTIDKGHHGDVPLDGLKMVFMFRWPGAIHEGHGQVQLVVDERADEQQRNALLTIASGEDSDPGTTMFNVFASTMEKAYDPIFAPIEFEADVEGRRGRVRVPDLVEAEGRPLKNPVTGEDHRAEVYLPQGFEYDVAEVARGTATTRGNISLSLQDTYGHFAHLHMTNHGVIHGRAVA